MDTKQLFFRVATYRSLLHDSLAPIVGYACFIAQSNVLFYGTGLVIAQQSAEGAFLRNEMSFILSTLAVVAALLAMAFCPQVNAVIQHKTMRIAAPCVIAASVFMIALAGDTPLGMVVFATGSIMSGFAWGLFALQWNVLLERMSVKEIFIVIALSITLAHAMSTVFPTVNSWGPLLLSSALPFVSAAILFFRLLRRDTAKDCLKGGACEVRAQTASGPVLPWSLLLRLGGCVFCWSLTNKLIRTTYALLDIEMVTGGSFAQAQAVATFIGLSVAIAFIAWMLLYPSRFKFGYIYRILFVFSLAGILFVPIASSSDSFSLVFYALNSVAIQMLRILLWILILVIVSSRRALSVRIFGIVAGLYLTGISFGSLLGQVFSQQGFAALPNAMNFLTMGAVVMLALCFVFIFTEADANSLMHFVPKKENGSLKNRCLALAASRKLSSREEDVMELIASGRDIAYIQNKLCLSKSTVSTHRTHIYQKLGIHSKQELLDLLEQVDPTHDVIRQEELL